MHERLDGLEFSFHLSDSMQSRSPGKLVFEIGVRPAICESLVRLTSNWPLIENRKSEA